MIRYRCPHCAALTAAHERRVGQLSVCKACVKPHSIPSDKSLWLNEAGEQLYPPEPETSSEVAPEPVVLPATVPAIELPPEDVTNQSLLAPTQPDMELSEPVRVGALASTPLPSAPREPEREPVAASALPTRAVFASARSSPTTESPEPVANVAPRHDPATVAVATPPERNHSTPTSGSRSGSPRRATATSVARPAQADEERGEPVQLQTQADIAVALTAALTNRMKPPPAPRRDLRPSTAAWMLLTAGGVAFVLLGLFSNPLYLVLALILGGAQMVAGYAWVVRLAFMRDSQRGALCAIPPLTIYYLAQYKYAKLRPLRFVATGAILVVLALASPSLAPHARTLVKRKEPPPVAAPDPATMSKLEQLRLYREQRSYDSLLKLLELLAKTDPLLSEDAKDRAALSAELKLLCQHPLTDVKVHAMDAYSRWEPDGARVVCLAAVRSPTQEERRMALKLLPQWKDHESALAVQSLIGRPGTVETNRAKAALEEIGGAPAEQAAIALLHRAEDQLTKFSAFSILKKAGGAETAALLRRYALASDDQAVRTEAFAAAKAIEDRLQVPAPDPIPPAPKPSP